MVIYHLYHIHTHAAALIGEPLTVITWCSSQIPNLNWISLIFVILTFSTQFWGLYQRYRAAAGQGIWDQHGLALVWSDSTGRPQPPASGTHIHQPSDDQQRKVTLYHSQIVWRLWIFSSHNYYIHECLWYYTAHCPCTACQRKCCLGVTCYLMKIALKCWQTSHVESSNQSSF